MRGPGTTPPHPPSRPTSATLARLALLVFVLVLFTSTHWPELQFDAGSIERPDLVLHILAFGALGAIAVNAQLFGGRTSARNALLTAIVCALYAGFDEGTQAIPILKRHAVWDDFFANLLGVALGTGAAFGLFRAIAARSANT